MSRVKPEIPPELVWKRKKIYVAGPMRGLPEFNFPAFNKVTEELRSSGHVVFNPAERDLSTGFDPTGMKGTDEELSDKQFNLREALRDDMVWICMEADAVYLLPGWEKSRGAKAERALAEALGLEIVHYHLPGEQVEHPRVPGIMPPQFDASRLVEQPEDGGAVVEQPEHRAGEADADRVRDRGSDGGSP